MLPSSGAAMLRASGPNSDQPASSNTTARPRMSSPCPPYSGGDVRREDAGLAGGLLQVGAQLLAARAHHAGEPLLLGRDDGAHERRGPGRQLGDVRVGGQVDRHQGLSISGEVSARARARSAMRTACRPRAFIRSSELSPRRCRT